MNENMRIVFMGTPEFAGAILQRLIDTKRNVVGIFSQPDKPQGRKQIITPTVTKTIGEKYGIPVYQPQKLRDGTALEIMKELAPDLIVVAAYGKILPKDILDVPPMGCVNVHGSLLPKYRGAAPIQWAVLNGDSESGVTIMYMAEGMDTGDMIMKAVCPIGENETSGELFEDMEKVGADAIEKALSLFDEGNVPREVQCDDDATVAPMLSKEMAEIDFGKSMCEVHNLVRGMNPWPIAYTYFDGKVLKVMRTEKAPGYEGKPGEILDERKFIVGCCSGAVLITECQMEGKNRTSGEDFMRGRHPKAGTVIGGKEN